MTEHVTPQNSEPRKFLRRVDFGRKRGGPEKQLTGLEIDFGGGIITITVILR